jgi:hypothetical protein
MAEHMDLRETGIPIRRLRRDAEPARMGDETIPERAALRHDRSINIVARVAERQHNLEHLDATPASYAGTVVVTARDLTP